MCARFTIAGVFNIENVYFAFLRKVGTISLWRK